MHLVALYIQSVFVEMRTCDQMLAQILALQQNTLAKRFTETDQLS